MVPTAALAQSPGAQLANRGRVSRVVPKNPVIVEMQDDEPMYRPPKLTIRAGQTVEWKNIGTVMHSVSDDPVRASAHSDGSFPAGSKPFSSRGVMPGQSFRHTFTVPGTYHYFCLTHETDKMVGEITVLEPEKTSSSPGRAAHKHKSAELESASREVPSD
jgi:plastocyanin